MSTRVRVPLAIVSALSMLALWSGAARAADDPVQTVTDCLTGLTATACTAPLDTLVPGGTTDPGAASAPDAPVADSGPATRQGAPTCDDLAGGLGLPDCPGLPGGETAGGSSGESTDNGTGAGTGDGAGGTAAPLCALVSQVPAIPGLPDLSEVTCVQLPGVLCPLLPANPELSAVVGLICPRTPVQPGTTIPAPVVQPAAQPVSYDNCDAARAAGAAPIAQGQPGYRPELDGDSDGLACENDQTSGTPAVAAPVLAASGRLAYTGVTPLPLLLTGAALLLLGGGFLLAGRRRA
ncbi:MAG: putative secreted protein [Modestobacter sp.]|nr:putative secreted protein [Modestobacter sp.]